MKRAALMIIAVLVAMPAISAARQAALPSAAESARRCGLGEIKCEVPILEDSQGLFRRYKFGLVHVLPPIGRVYEAALNARAKYLPFGPEAVSPELLEATITVRARDDSETAMSKILSVSHLVIVPRGQKGGVGIRPVSIHDWNAEVKNLAGATFQLQGKEATFSIAELPVGDFDIIAVDAALIRIAGDDRKKLQAWCDGQLVVK